MSICAAATLFTGFCLVLCLSAASPESLFSEEVTAYEMLEKFNFPKGILPEGVKGYVLHEDGSFEVFLNGDCKFEVDGGYSLSYRKMIKGKVTSGSLKELQGVSVKVFFLWLTITEVRAADGQLDFYVGPISASFPLSNFNECPRCGCGLNCSYMLSDM